MLNFLRIKKLIEVTGLFLKNTEKFLNNDLINLNNFVYKIRLLRNEYLL